MKIILYWIYLSQIVALAAATTRWTEEDQDLESRQIALWSEKVLESSSWGDEVKLKEFTLGLESLSYRSKMDNHDPKIDGIYREIQEAVISIPGHTNYFTDKIEECWKAKA
jgi:hypothetical protein